MGIIRTNDPLQFTQVDGIVINESAPAPSVVGVAANVAILVGTAQRGPQELREITSVAMMKQLFGVSKTHGINKVLKGKAFGRLKFIRVLAAAAAIGTKTFKDATLVDIITFKAKYKGAYGNLLKVKIEAGTTAGKKYTITDENPDTTNVTEVYDNVLITEVVSKAIFAASKLVDVVVVATTAEASNVAATALAGGADGNVADTDYETAIALAQQENAGNILFLDDYNATRNGYLKSHAALTNDKQVACQLAATDTVATAVTAAGTLRDTEGRIIICYGEGVVSVDGAEVEQPAAYFMASTISQTSPSVDPAFVENSQYCAGILRITKLLSRADYVLLAQAGICALEFDSDFGHKFKSGITSQILNSEKVTILRRRMTDFLTVSVAKYLVNYQNAPNTLARRKAAKAAVESFDKKLELAGMLPSDAEMTDGAKAKIIDIDTVNTNQSISNGEFHILYRRRIYSSMRYIILSAQIGTGVVVKEGEV